MTTVLSNIETKKKEKPRYTPGSFYSFSINPDDKHQFNGRLDRLKAFKQFMFQQSITWQEMGIAYKMCIEISDVWDILPLSLGTRCHTHGILYLKDAEATTNFLTHFTYLVSRYAYCNIDTIDDPEKWITYCEKQQPIIGKQVLSSNDNLFQECISHYQGLKAEDTDRPTLKRDLMLGPGTGFEEDDPLNHGLMGGSPSLQHPLIPDKKTKRRYKGKPMEPALVQPSNILLDFSN